MFTPHGISTLVPHQEWGLEIRIDLIWLHNKVLEMEPGLRLVEIVGLLENTVGSQGEIEEEERGKKKEKEERKHY